MSGELNNCLNLNDETSSASLVPVSDPIQNPTLTTTDKIETVESFLSAGNLVDKLKLFDSLDCKVDDTSPIMSGSDLVDDPNLSSPANDKVEDPLSIMSDSNSVKVSKSFVKEEIDDPLCLPTPNLGDRPSFLSANFNLVKDPFSLSVTKEKVKDLTSNPELALVNSNIEDPVLLPPTDKIGKDTCQPALDKEIDPLLLPSAYDQAEDIVQLIPVKVEYPLLASSADNQAEDNEQLISVSIDGPLLTFSDDNQTRDTNQLITVKVDDLLSLFSSGSKDSSQLIQPSDIEDFSLLSKSSDDNPTVRLLLSKPPYCHKLPQISLPSDVNLEGNHLSSFPTLQIQDSFSLCSDISPNDDVETLSEDDAVISPTQSDHTKPTPLVIDDSIWKNMDSTDNKEGCKSDSDDDVIFIERNEEVIEVSDSDDESGNHIDDLVKVETFSLPQEVVGSLRAASKSSLFNNPGLSKTKRRSSFRRTKSILKKNRKSIEGQRRKAQRLNKPTEDSETSTLSCIKKKKELYENEDRMLSVVHLDPNAPPEFCQVSRSGRLIKKPIRLRGNISLFKKTGRGRKRSSKGRKEEVNIIDLDVKKRNMMAEKKRRQTLQSSFDKVLKEIQGDFVKPQKFPKIVILNQALDTIQQLEKKVNVSKSLLIESIKLNKLLKKQLWKLKSPLHE